MHAVQVSIQSLHFLAANSWQKLLIQVPKYADIPFTYYNHSHITYAYTSPREKTDIILPHILYTTPHRAKLARFCTTLATSVSFREVLSTGYSWQSRKRLGDKMAGQKKRRKMEPLISFMQASSLSGPKR